MILKILHLDNNNEVAKFAEGVHTIGRGDTLQCQDKRVSRSHAVITVNQSAVTLTAIHSNPCFLKSTPGHNLTILSKDNTANLVNGDTFALLPDAFWYKVQIHDSDADQKNQGQKRTSWEPGEIEEKRQRCDDSYASTSADVTLAVRSNIEYAPEVADSIKVEPEDKVIDPNNADQAPSQEFEFFPEIRGESESIQNHETEPAAQPNSDGKVSTKDEIKTERPSTSRDDGDTDKNAAGPSSTDKKPLRRERCWYGAGCYRKNSQHRTDLSHPGDSDYASDPEDDRPLCPYGAACYRRNPDHRKQYKHPPGPPPSKNKRRKRKPRLGPLQNVDDEDDEEEEDPFINDGSSDEYVADSDGSDSDWDDSQSCEEESQELRTLKKEAKKFTQK